MGEPGVPLRFKGRPGRCYRAANVLVAGSLKAVGFPGKKRRALPGGKFRKIGEAATTELLPQAFEWNVDRGLGTRGEAENRAPTWGEHARELVEERDHVRERDKTEGRVGVRKAGRVAFLETKTRRELGRRLAARRLDHCGREVDSDDLGLGKAPRDRQRAGAGARAEVEGLLRRFGERGERCFESGEVVGISHRVPARRESLELEPQQGAEEAPQSRPADDGVRRHPRKPATYARREGLTVAQGVLRWIRTSWPGSATNISAALPPLIASATLR